MKVYLKTLSPLHIGTGEALSALDYVVEGNKLYRVSQKQFGEFLKQYPDLINPYGEWVMEITASLEELKDRSRKGDRQEKRDANQIRRDLQKKFNLLSFCKEAGKEKEFSAFIKKQPGIKSLPVKAPRGRLKQQIRGMVVHPATGQPYLPGSSLKGSIRTALIYQMLEDHGGKYRMAILDHIRKELRSKDRRSKIAKRVGKEIEFSTSYCGVKVYNRREKREETSYQDEKYDLFKFLQVTDALPYQEQVTQEVVNTDLYLVNRTQDRQTKNVSWEATRQPQAPAIEAISPLQVFEAEVHFQMEALWLVYQHPQQGKWLKLEEKVKDLFGLDLKSVSQDNLAEKQAEVESHIQQSLTRFAREQLAFEKKWVEKQMLDNPWDRRLPLDKKGFQAVFQAFFDYPHNGRTLLRTGFATGFPAKTEMLYMLNDPDLRQAMVEVMEKLEIGKKPGRGGGKRYEPNLEKFPKSRTLVSYEHDIQPLGWLEWIPEKEWQGRSELRMGIQARKASATKAKSSEKIVPQYPKAQEVVKKGSILDGFVFKKPAGAEKKVRVYVGKGKDQDVMLAYSADVILGRIIRVEVMEMQEDQIINIAFKGFKRENR